MLKNGSDDVDIVAKEILLSEMRCARISGFVSPRIEWHAHRSRLPCHLMDDGGEQEDRSDRRK